MMATSWTVPLVASARRNSGNAIMIANVPAFPDHCTSMRRAPLAASGLVLLYTALVRYVPLARDALRVGRAGEPTGASA